MRIVLAAVLAAFLSVFAVPAVAATTGVVRGVVTVRGVPQAGVSLTIVGEGTLLKTTSEVSGAYIFSQVPFGHYRLTAHSAGVKDVSIDLDVASDSISNLNFALGDLKTIATTQVTARAGASGTPVSQNSLDRRQIASLPTNDSLNKIVQTVPGIVRFSYDEPVAHGFHGLTYEIDGAPIPQATSANFASIIDPKNVDSIEILTGAFPAEYGGSRMGAVVNIISSRGTDLTQPEQGLLTLGVGNYGSSQATLDEAVKAGALRIFLNANSQRTDRGIDTPTFTPIHDDNSNSNQLLRILAPVGSRGSLAFDYSNQLAQFQIPINVDPNNSTDPQVSPPGTDDVQREYDRYANLNFSLQSKDGNGYLQIIPWYRYTRIAFLGDLPNDVLATFPNPSPPPAVVNLVGLRQDRFATYAGLRVADFRTSTHHAIKVGLDLNRENFSSNEQFAQLGSPDVFQNVQQAGSQIGFYAQDKWSPSQILSVDYGLRYDHSTGFVGGNQLSPRIGVNIAPDGKNVVHFYYGRFYSAPQLEDVRGACVALSGCPPNPPYDLKPETDNYYEMGIAHTFSPRMNGYVNFFEKNVTNVLDTTQLLNTPLFAVFNNALGRDEGVEMRLQDRFLNGDSWFLSGTVSHSEAAGISGSTFLFPPNVNPPGPITAADFQPEDHDQIYEANGAFTHRFGASKSFFATLQGEYGTGYPVQFQSGPDRLPAHFTFDLGIGKEPGRGAQKSLGFNLDVQNLFNHQYVIKIANGFNTTQIATGRQILFRVSAPI
ncbi:MAG: TonB-dependent receptor [Candidatus Baltobacteraceae bacterium]